MVLRARKAWKKKIKVGASFIYFDHDYPYEIVKKRKEYTAIKKLLKEKNIWFQRRKISRLRELLGWLPGKGNGLVTAMRAKDKLQGFQRDPVV